MKQLAIFTAPKPFRNQHITVIQRNAIQSWREMGSNVEVLVVGEDEGVAEAAAELGVTQIKNVKRNQHGTPLVSSIFHLAREASQAPLLAYVNADLLLFPETLHIALNVLQQRSEFVLLGQRHDLDVHNRLDFSRDWPDWLRSEVQARGHLHPMGGSDYFIFPRHLFSQIPNFAIGRAGWDNWMIYHAISQNWPTIDATSSLKVVHQNHDYAHLAGEQTHQRHPETFENTALAGGMRKMYMLLDVEYELIDGKIRQVHWTLPRFLRRLERRLQPEELVGHGPRWYLLRGLRKLRRALSGIGIS